MTGGAAIRPLMRQWFEGADGLRAFHMLCRVAEGLGPGRYEMTLTNLETLAHVECVIIVSPDTGKAEIALREGDAAPVA